MRRAIGIGMVCMSAIFGGAPWAPTGTASAQSMESMQLAESLGDVLASEEFCGLSYNQDAIRAFIDKHVRADDMQFTSTLQMMVSGNKVQNKEMSPSAKTAHCAQITRVARSYNFIK